MRKGKILLIVIIVFILGIIAVKIFEYRREKNVNSFTFPITLNVKNYTDHIRADTMAMVILNKIFDIDTVNILIVYAPSLFDNSDFELLAMIQKEKYGTHNYTLFVKKSKYHDIKESISHEMIHVKQMEDGDLIPMNNKMIVYKNDTIFFSKTPYEMRDYEKEAFKETRNIKKQLNKLLYK